MTKLDDNNLPDRIDTIDDEKKRVLDLYDTTIPVPVGIGIFDAPTRCYEINEQWAAIVLGFCSWLTEIAAWKEAQDENYYAIQEISKFLQGKDCEVPTLLRQNPEDNCQLQYSIDNGETWSLAFDYSLCMSIVDGASETSQTILIQAQVNNFYNSTYQTFKETVFNNYTNNYVDSITNIYPELGYGDADDSFRDEALCYALKSLIDAVCEAAIAYFDDLDDTAGDLQRNLATAAAIVGILALAAAGVAATGGLAAPAAGALAAQAGLWGAGIGLGSALGGALFNQFTSTNRAAYEDTAARQDVVCCLLDNLIGANVDQADLVAAFGCGGLSANAQAIHDAASILVGEDATYAAFAEKLSIGYQSAKLGLLPDCGCTDGWCIEIFPHIDMKDGQINVGTISGTGLEGELITALGQGDIREVPNLTLNRYYTGIILDFGEIYDCDGLEIIVDYTFSGTLGGNDLIRTYWDDDLIGNGSLLGQLTIGATGSFTWTRSVGLVGDFRYLYIDARGTEPVTINRVYVAGPNAKPVAITSDLTCE